MNVILSILNEDKTSQKNTEIVKVLCYFGLFSLIK